MSDLSVGTLITSSTKTYVSGTASELDTEALIEIAVAEYTDKADEIQIKVDENDAKINAYDEYYGLCTDLQEALSTLKSISGYSSTYENVFETRTGTLSSTGTDASYLIDVEIEDEAPIGSHQLTIVQKAEAMSATSTEVSSSDEGLSYTGEFTIGLDDTEYEVATITVTSDMSLQDIADEINEYKDTSGVEASIVKVSENTYQLVIEGTDTNEEIVVSTNSGTVLSDLGFTDGMSDNIQESQITQEPQGSIVTYNSTTITRDDNTYDDLIDGVTFEINEADEETTVTLDVENDVSSAEEAIEAFVEAYNTLREFILTNQTVTDGEISDDASLFSETLIDNLSYSLSNILSESHSDGSVIQSLRDLGIEYDENNYLVIEDSTTLEDALLDNFEEVMNFFSTEVTISDSSLALITNESIQESLSFDMEITVDESGDIASVSVNGSTTSFEVSGTRITGAEGTIYEGLTFAYSGDTNTTISVGINAGMADLIYNSLEAYTETDGLIDAEIDNLGEENDDLEENIEELEEKAEEVYEEQVEKYAAFEAKMETLNQLLNTVRALLGIDDDD